MAKLPPYRLQTLFDMREKAKEEAEEVFAAKKFFLSGLGLPSSASPSSSSSRMVCLASVCASWSVFSSILLCCSVLSAGWGKKTALLLTSSPAVKKDPCQRAPVESARATM